MGTLCGEAGRSIIGIAAIVSPVVHLREVPLVRHSLHTTHDVEHTVMHTGILGLIILQLLVAHEAHFVSPVPARSAIDVKFIMPDQLIALIDRDAVLLGWGLCLAWNRA